MKYLAFVLIGLVSLSSCSKEDLFEQPSIEVTGYSLKDLPGEFTHLEIDIILTNNDTREVHLADVEYQVVIEEISSEVEESDIDMEIPVNTPLELTLPLTLVTNDAIQLLAKLDAGEELEYSVTGTFHVDDAILKRFDFPINIQGTAYVEAGFEDFYEQPEVIVNEMEGSYSILGLTSYQFDFDVDCSVENIDVRDVLIDEVEYVVYIEGVQSETHLYSDSYSANFAIAGETTETLVLPVRLTLGISGGLTLVSALSDNTVEYIVKGTFHAIEVDGTAADFLLPLYVEGSVPATMLSL